MYIANYTFQPGTGVEVLIPGECAGTFTVKPAVVNLVDVQLALRDGIVAATVVNRVVLTEDQSIRYVADSEVFLTREEAVTEAVARFESSFNL